MTIGMIIVMLGSLGLVVGLTVAMPNISRPTVPLGVSVPSNRVHDPVVSAAIRRFRGWSLIGGLLAAVATVLTATWPAINAVILLLYVVWTMTGMALARRPIQRAKAAEGWYEGVAVRVSADVTPGRSARPLWGLHLLALGVSVAAILAVCLRFHTLPDPMPVHYDDAGQADTWAARSWPSALLPGLVGLAGTVLLVGVSILLAHRHDTRFPDGHPAAARQLDLGNAHALQVALGWIALIMAAVMSLLAVAPVVRLTPSGLAWCTWLGVGATMLPVVWLIVDSARRHRAALETAGAAGPESPDDDRLWKWGLFYVNRADPRMWVPKRNGMGLDANLGHPGGLAFMLGVGLIMLACVALAVSQQVTR